MRTRQKDRDDVIARLTRALPDHPPHIVIDLARKLLRAGTTLHRLSEAQCNGDWPYDNGERKVIPCSRCEAGTVRSALVRDKTAPKRTGPGETDPHWIPLICPDCRTQDRVQALLRPFGLVPHFAGDPRGAVLVVSGPGIEANDWERKGVVIA